MFEIEICAPGKNALGTSAMEDLLAKLDQAAGRPILLTGKGDVFSAGLNLKEVMSFERADMQRFLDLLVQLMDSWFTYPAPTVALVNGHAIAGGCILALACDYRVALADPKIRIGVNEVALGLRFPPSILRLVRHRVPRQHLDLVVLGAGLYSPADALRLGLVDEISTDAWSSAERAIRALSCHPPAAYAAAKKDLHPSIVGSSAEDERFLEDGLPTWTSPELKERIAKVLGR